MGVGWDVNKVDNIECWMCLEQIDKVQAEGSESSLHRKAVGYGVRVIWGGMVKGVAIGGDEA